MVLRCLTCWGRAGKERVKISSPTSGGTRPWSQGTQHSLVCPLSQQRPARCPGSQCDTSPAAQLRCCRTLEQLRERQGDR